MKTCTWVLKASCALGTVPARPQGEVGSAGHRWGYQVPPMKMVGFFGKMGANLWLKNTIEDRVIFWWKQILLLVIFKLPQSPEMIQPWARNAIWAQIIVETFRLNEKAENNPEKETVIHESGVLCHFIWFGMGWGERFDEMLQYTRIYMGPDRNNESCF